jgi:small-conductance mechanosensitive channel
MNAIRKVLGVVWILFSVLTAYYIVSTAIREISAGIPEDASVFWPIIILIFLPILFGFALFGYYSLKEEYN